MKKKELTDKKPVMIIHQNIRRRTETFLPVIISISRANLSAPARETNNQRVAKTTRSYQERNRLTCATPQPDRTHQFLTELISKGFLM